MGHLTYINMYYMQGSVTAVDISSAKVTAIKRLASACRVPLGMVRLVAADFREWAAEQVRRKLLRFLRSLLFHRPWET